MMILIRPLILVLLSSPVFDDEDDDDDDDDDVYLDKLQTRGVKKSILYM
jgi:hypothetical protein